MVGCASDIPDYTHVPVQDCACRRDDLPILATSSCLPPAMAVDVTRLFRRHQAVAVRSPAISGVVASVQKPRGPARAQVAASTSATSLRALRSRIHEPLNALGVWDFGRKPAVGDWAARAQWGGAGSTQLCAHWNLNVPRRQTGAPGTPGATGTPRQKPHTTWHRHQNRRAQVRRQAAQRG